MIIVFVLRLTWRVFPKWGLITLTPVFRVCDASGNISETSVAYLIILLHLLKQIC